MLTACVCSFQIGTYCVIGSAIAVLCPPGMSSCLLPACCVLG